MMRTRSVLLRPISRRAADALRAGRRPDDVVVADDHPTEFSAETAETVGAEWAFGPFFIHRREDEVVVGEIGGALAGAHAMEIGYAIVTSLWGRGYATDAVRELVAAARDVPGLERLVAHAPLERPASGRVLEKAGFALAGVVDHEHDGVAMRVQRWELEL